MKLIDFKKTDRLTRPVGNWNTLANGAYLGQILVAQLAERNSKYSEDGKMVVLELTIRVEDGEEIIPMKFAVNYSWSKMGKLIGVLENLELLPEPGEDLCLDDFVGIPVEVIVENSEKDGNNFSNIVRIKKVVQLSPQAEENSKRIYSKPFYQEAAKNLFNTEENNDVELA